MIFIWVFILESNFNLNPVFVVHWRSCTSSSWEVYQDPYIIDISSWDCRLWCSWQLWSATGEDVLIVYGTGELMARDIKLAWDQKPSNFWEQLIWVTRIFVRFCPYLLWWTSFGFFHYNFVSGSSRNELFNLGVYLWKYLILNDFIVALCANLCHNFRLPTSPSNCLAMFFENFCIIDTLLITSLLSNS